MRSPVCTKLFINYFLLLPCIVSFKSIHATAPYQVSDTQYEGAFCYRCKTVVDTSNEVITWQWFSKTATAGREWIYGPSKLCIAQNRRTLDESFASRERCDPTSVCTVTLAIYHERSSTQCEPYKLLRNKNR